MVDPRQTLIEIPHPLPVALSPENSVCRCNTQTNMAALMSKQIAAFLSLSLSLSLALLTVFILFAHHFLIPRELVHIDRFPLDSNRISI
jgi:hypothetical protein